MKEGELMDAEGKAMDWVNAILLASDSVCPADLLEEAMSARECAPFGPVHHYLVGASLLACAHNAMGTEGLPAHLAELERRAGAVPGGTCARWGVCGAAVSCGMALSILLENAPLKAEGWSETQLMVADLAEKIARAGAPRCCKRDSRIAVRAATGWFNKLLGASMTLPSSDATCGVSSRNEACLGNRCPYFK